MTPAPCEEFESPLGPHRRSNRQVEEAEEENQKTANWGGSPHWTRFELLWPEARSARTTPIAFRPMTYARGGYLRPAWAPRLDPSRTAIPRLIPDGWWEMDSMGVSRHLERVFPTSEWSSITNRVFDRLSVTGSPTCAAPYGRPISPPKRRNEHSRMIDIMRKYFRLYAAFLLASALQGAVISAARFLENPLITVASSPSVGDNLNGPSIIRVPPWIKKPLGRYYMYFAHHKGQY